MEYSPELLAKAAEFAAHHHGGQVDKLGDPYLLHVHRVSAVAYREYGIFHAIVGMLHDVVEDTDATTQQVFGAFGPEVTFAVIALTRDDEGETYVDYIDRVSTHEVATQVKMLDLMDNLNRNDRLTGPESDSLRKRYIRALDILQDVVLQQEAVR